jgi:hypothetical protein
MADKIELTDFQSTALNAAIEIVNTYSTDFDQLEGAAKIEAITNRVADVFTALRYGTHLADTFVKDQARTN